MTKSLGLSRLVFIVDDIPWSLSMIEQIGETDLLDVSSIPPMGQQDKEHTELGTVYIASGGTKINDTIITNIERFSVWEWGFSDFWVHTLNFALFSNVWSWKRSMISLN